jgi:phage head maturation protease
MKLETRSFAGQVELRGDDQRTLVGVAVPYDVEARIGPRLVETFARGAFEGTDPAEVVLTVPHPRDNAQLPIGRTLALRDEPDGLHGEWYVPATRDGDEVLALAAAGVPLGLSVGFIPLPGGSRYSDGGRRVERRPARPRGRREAARVRGRPGGRPTRRRRHARAAAAHPRDAGLLPVSVAVAKLLRGCLDCRTWCAARAAASTASASVSAPRRRPGPTCTTTGPNAAVALLPSPSTAPPWATGAPACPSWAAPPTPPPT